MKIVTLNIQHGGGRRINTIADYLIALRADLLVLTEFRENANASLLRSKLGSHGFIHFAGATISQNQNSVCIFCRRPFLPRTYPDLSPQHAHRIVAAHFEKLAIYGVYFPQNQAKAEVFQFLLDGAHLPGAEAHVILGDFNTGLHGLDETGATFFCADQFAALSRAGLVDSWRTRNPAVREFSWYSNAGNGFRIDHVFSSPAADGKVQRVYYDHAPRKSGITDHSAMMVEHGDQSDIA